MPDNKSQVHFKVDRHAKELAKEKLEFGELSKVLRDEVRRVAFGEEISKRQRLTERLESLREERDELRAEKRRIESDIDEKETEIARVEERMGGLERKEERYEAQIEMLEEQLLDGSRLFEDHGGVIKAAKTGGKQPKAVLQELEDRNPRVPGYAFEEKMHSREEWNGLSKESEE